MAFATIETLALRHRMLSALRRFFDSAGYVEVETPVLVPRTVPELHIDLVRTTTGLYLAASPEPQMKRLVASGMERIYQVGHAFRAGERGRWHGVEFSILEWYRTGAGYRDLMDEVEALVTVLCPVAGRDVPAFVRMSVDDAFERWAGYRPSGHMDAGRFDRDLVERVEPGLSALGAVMLFDYPAAAASLAKLRRDDPGLAERFELYVDGIEIANGFTELTDVAEQRARFDEANAARRADGREAYDVDTRFLSALERGLPSCAGVAVGLDRLVAVLAGFGGIDDVMSHPFEEL